MIVTFYSYKGGVGRTQLLSNIAAYLCYYQDKKVLVIDWDLEAPGLHFYFERKTIKQKGLIELFSDYCELMSNNEDVTQEYLENYLTEIFPTFIIENTINSISGNGSVDLVTAGLYDKEYSRRVNSFDWQKFYKTLDGGIFIEILKKYLKEQKYDFIFIDSRTGVNDYSGICNIQMPDANVIVIAPNEQNINGSKERIKEIQSNPYISKYHKREPLIFPILSRLDDFINAKKVEWIGAFRENFNDIIEQLINKANNGKYELTASEILEDIEFYVSQTLLEYKADLSYGERLLFEKEKVKIEMTTLEDQFETIANLLSAFKDYPLVKYKSLPFLNTKTKYQRVDSLLEKFKLNDKEVFLDENELYLLTNLSLLPSNFDYTQLLELIDNFSFSNQKLHDYLYNLERKGWLEKLTTTQYFFSPILQNLIIKQYGIDEKRLYDLINKFNTILYLNSEKNNSQENIKWLPYGEMMLKRISKENEIVANLYNNLAIVCKAASDSQKAFDYNLKAVSIREKLLSPKNTDLATSYNNISIDYKEAKKYDEALSYILKAINIWEEVLPPNHPNIATAYANIAEIHVLLRNYQIALEYSLKALAIREQIFTKEDYILGSSYTNLGNVYANLGNNDMALKYYLKALNIAEKKLNPMHPDLAMSYNNLGFIYEVLGDINAALKYNLKAVEILEKVLQPSHITLGLAYNNLSFTYHKLKKFDLALEYEKKALRIALNFFPFGNDNIKAAINKMSSILTDAIQANGQEAVMPYIEWFIENCADYFKDE